MGEAVNYGIIPSMEKIIADISSLENPVVAFRLKIDRQVLDQTHFGFELKGKSK